MAEKSIDFGYNADGQFSSITRFADLAGTQLVATGTYTYDTAGRLTSLTYTKDQTTLVDHDWTYNSANEITEYINSIDGTADYTSDDLGQLTGADYDYQTDESYTYDDNGNRTNTGYVTGTNNLLLSDGTYRYTYDDSGNRTAKFVDTDADGVLDSGDTDITTYTWDYRNRLTGVVQTATYGGAVDHTVDYAYDYANRLVFRTVDAGRSGGTVPIQESAYVYDGNQIALQFDKIVSGPSDLSASDLSHRYLWGPAVDQLLADEHVESLGTAGDVVWPLVDNLGTVRDLATYDSNTDVTTIANHRVYDAYGNRTSQTNSAVDCLFGYTARQYDEVSNLQNNLNRWYDAKVGRWVSEDPIGFRGGDTNVYRYVGNTTMIFVDPNGLKPGDPFDSPDDAARDWKNRYHGLTAKDHRERGSTIYRTKDNKFSYSEPAVAPANSSHEVTPSAPPRDNNGVAGIIHSHTVQNEFSDWDVDQAMENQEKLKKKGLKALPEYLVTPKGALLKMDLNNEKEPVTQIPCKNKS